MAKTITFEYKDVTYTLEYTRRTIKQMETEGFVARKMEDMPMTLLPDLFAGAFKAHHRKVKRELIDEIYASMSDKEKLIGALSEMYTEPLESLMDEPEEGNVEWTPSW